MCFNFAERSTITGYSWNTKVNSSENKYNLDEECDSVIRYHLLTAIRTQKTFIESFVTYKLQRNIIVQMLISIFSANHFYLNRDLYATNIHFHECVEILIYIARLIFRIIKLWNLIVKKS